MLNFNFTAICWLIKFSLLFTTNHEQVNNHFFYLIAHRTLSYISELEKVVIFYTAFDIFSQVEPHLSDKSYYFSGNK